MAWNKILPTLCLLLALPALAADVDTAKIDWLTSYHEGIERAQALNKPVLIDFYAPWCGPCHMMDEQTFVDPDVIKAMGDFVNVKINIDADEKTAFAYGVQSIPRTVVLNIHGEMVGDRVGFMERDDYLAYLKDVEEYLRVKVDGTVITVEEDGPKVIEFAPDAGVQDVMTLLADPKPAVRKKAREALLKLDEAIVKAWMRQGLASPYLGDRVAAKEVLASLEPDVVVGFDPWAAEAERAAFLAALAGKK